MKNIKQKQILSPGNSKSDVIYLRHVKNTKNITPLRPSFPVTCPKGEPI